MADTSRNLAELSEKVNNDTFKIQVMGTFSNGKSTFINSLLGENVLPAYALPTTAVINEVKYGEEKNAILYFENPLPEPLHSALSTNALEHMKAHEMTEVPPLEIDYRDIEEYVVIPMGEDPKEMLLESPYRNLELYWPLDILKEGVEIIDTPGLNEDSLRTETTMSYLPKADAILFILNATALCGQPEMEFIEDVLIENGFTDTFFITNKYDLIRDAEKEKMKKFAHLKLSEYTTNPLFFVSASKAVEGTLNNDSVMVAESGMPAFEQYLLDFLTKKKGLVKLSQPARRLKSILNEQALFKIIPQQRSLLEHSLDDVQARYDAAKPQLEALRRKKDQIIAKLQLRIEQSKQEFRRALNTHSVSIAQMIPGWIQAYTPKATVGLVPSKAKVTRVVNEISEHVNGKIAEYQKNWKNEVMMPTVSERAAYIFDSSEQDLSKLFAEIDDINMQLTGVDEVEHKNIPVWQRVLGGAAGLALGMPDIAIAGGINGLTKELAKNVGLVLGTEAILALMLGLTNPFVLVGGIAVGLIGGHFLNEGAAIGQLKTKLTEVYVSKMSENADQSALATSESIASKLTEIAEQISSAVDVEINQSEAQIAEILEEMRKGQENIDRRKAILQKCEDKIKEINNDLDDLIFELLGQK